MGFDGLIGENYDRAETGLPIWNIAAIQGAGGRLSTPGERRKRRATESVAPSGLPKGS
jgi:hypothetical protein